MSSSSTGNPQFDCLSNAWSLEAIAAAFDLRLTLPLWCSLFLDKEEDNVIRLSSLEDDAAAAGTPEQVHAVYKRFVNFHGELLLMVHWSILAYTGLVKILKKHHKRTGLLVRAPHLDNLLSQPFCSIEVGEHAAANNGFFSKNPCTCHNPSSHEPLSRAKGGRTSLTGITAVLHASSIACICLQVGHVC